MKRIATLLLSLLLVVGASGAMAADITLSLGVWPQDTDVRGLEVAENYQLPAFEEKRPDVEVVKAPYEYNVDTFVPLAESGNLPNLFYAYFTEPQKIVSAGFAADITDALDAKGWLSKMSEGILDAVTIDDRVYGVPRDAYPLGLMINAELFEEAGLVDENGIPLYPKTWDELIDVSKTIKEETGSAGFVLLAKDNAGGWHFSNIAWTFGAEFETMDEDGKWIAHLNSPEVVAALQMVKDMKWEHDILTSDPTAEDWGTGFQQLGTGSAAMYIAADDAVNQPTANYGLPTDKLMLVGIPEGPAGSYTLMGGTLYMFSPDSTPEQIDAGLDWLETIGYAPVLTETTKEGKIAGAKNNVELGVPVMKGIQVWNDEEYNALNDEIYDEYVNVDPAMFAPFYEATTKAGALRGEEPVQTQDLYAELTKAMQEVLTNKDADVQAVLDIANENFQKLLDESVNK